MRGNPNWLALEPRAAFVLLAAYYARWAATR
jgi:hypothetical protein